MQVKKKVALAFSGGLDTSFCVKYLSQEKNLEVHSVFINTGGFSATEEKKIEKRAYDLGVERHENIDVSEQYYQKCIRFMVYGNMMRNRNYPMSVSSERTFQAMAVAEYARREDIGMLAHGSTGAGNDQVRFEMIFQVLVNFCKVGHVCSPVGVPGYPLDYPAETLIWVMLAARTGRWPQPRQK